MTLAEAASRLPEVAAALDERAGRVEDDLGAMRRSVAQLDRVRRAVEPLDGRLEQVERELGRVREAVPPLEARLIGSRSR